MNSERITWKGSVLTAPVPPALITCGPADKPNVFTVAWTGTLCTQPPKTYISVRPERYSYGLIKESGVFCINLPTKKLIRAIDYCGVKSGRDIDKIKEMKLETTDAKTVPTVLLCDSPVSLECKV
ncbi:MAG: flavin reductase family protein, partial [Oscillospiraceae bacterium]|nr:flavin reductase family protein [Oscillospiraceae bacterium]